MFDGVPPGSMDDDRLRCGQTSCSESVERSEAVVDERHRRVVRQSSTVTDRRRISPVEMTDSDDKRRGPDRRRSRAAAGATRTSGATRRRSSSWTSRPSGRDACEAILAKPGLRWPPFDSLEKAEARDGRPQARPGARDQGPAGRTCARARCRRAATRTPLLILPLPEGDLSMSTLDRRSAPRAARRVEARLLTRDMTMAMAA